MTIRQRLFLWYGGVLIAVCGLFVAEIYLLVSHKMRKEFYQFLSDEYQEAVHTTNRLLDDPEALAEGIRGEARSRRFFGMAYRLYDLSKREDIIVVAARREDLVRKMPAAHLSRDAGGGIEIELDGPSNGVRLFTVGADALPENTSRNLIALTVGEDRGGEIHFLTGLPDPDGHPELLLQVGLSYRRVYRRIASLLHYFIAGFAGTIILATLGGSLIASRALRPVSRVADSIEHTSARNFSNRLAEPRSRDEIGRIVRSFNNMLQRLEEAFQYLQDFTADAAHELRTPLARVKCGLQVALERERDAPEYQQAIQEALDQLSRLSKLVNSLLLLANLNANPDTPEGREQIDLRDMLGQICEFFGIAAHEVGIDLRLDCPRPCLLLGNPVLLRQLFSNLIENAIRHTPPDGHVRIGARCRPQGCEITVANTGSDLQQKDLDRIFRRFYTGVPARTGDEAGFGLGLSISRKIVEAHNGTITADIGDNKETTFRVVLAAGFSPHQDDAQ